MLSEAYMVSLFHCDILTSQEQPLYFTKAEVDAMLTKMVSGTNGLWDIDSLGPTRQYISKLL
jgi:hypothetical protein